MEKIAELLRKLQEVEAERSILIEEGVIRLAPEADPNRAPIDPALLKLKKILEPAQND